MEREPGSVAAPSESQALSESAGPGARGEMPRRTQNRTLWFSPSKHLTNQCLLKSGDMENDQGLDKISPIHPQVCPEPHPCPRHWAGHCGKPEGHKSIVSRELHSRGE